jgi:hypothetical protein
MCFKIVFEILPDNYFLNFEFVFHSSPFISCNYLSLAKSPGPNYSSAICINRFLLAFYFYNSQVLILIYSYFILSFTNKLIQADPSRLLILRFHHCTNCIIPSRFFFFSKRK